MTKSEDLRGKHSSHKDCHEDPIDRDPKCSSCGEPRCTGQSAGRTKRCKRKPLPGVTVCKSHGGQLPGVARKSARARLFRDGQLSNVLVQLEKDEDPAQGLLEACRRAGGLMRFWAGRAGELAINLEYKPRELPDGSTVAYPESVLGLNKDNEAEVHVAVREYRSAIELYAKMCKLALDAGIAAAQVRVEAEKAQLFAQAIQAIFADLDLTPDQRVKAPELIRRHLLSLPEMTW